MKEYFNFAFQSIKHRKLRSWLTILGILVGIAAIVSLISVSEGLENAITEQFDNLGANKVYIFPKGAGSFISVQDETGLGDKDIDTLKKISELEQINSYLYDKTEVTFGKDDKFTNVAGFESESKPIEVFEGQGFKLQDGRWFREDEMGVAIVGSSLAEKAYKKEIFLNNRIEIEENKFRVIGILEPFGNEEDDNTVWVGMQEARSIFEEPEKINFIEGVAKEGVDIPKLAQEIKHDLEKVRDKEDVEVMIPEQILGQLSNILLVLQFVLGGIAAISLLVGGVGIMNSMYANVLERKKEIGILKAVGATPGDIKKIFIVEAGIIGLAGGILGTVLGVLISQTIGWIAESQGFILLQIKVEWPIIIFGILFAFTVGMLAGYFPAKEASKMLPVEALRK
jgi:putative ABC transport system permease protein